MSATNVVGVVRNADKIAALDELISITGFDQTLDAACGDQAKDDFFIVIKPNMMVYVHQKDWEAIITDHQLVEHLIDHMIERGYENVVICESRTDVSTMLKNRHVDFIAEQIGYRPKDRYGVVDLTSEKQPFVYEYVDDKGKSRKWKDFVGESWREADFRITFAKAKTHEHDWLTLGVKNVYGCFPATDKIRRYHMKDEVFDVTARSFRNFPVHFSFVDAHTGSDGFQGYKIAHPRPLQMLFGGATPVAVDMEIFERAGLDANKSHILRKTIEQIHHGEYPQYEVVGDTSTKFADICTWTNIKDETVEFVDRAEEVYVNWGFINLRPAAEYVDYGMFPPKNVIYRVAVWLMKVGYRFLSMFSCFRKRFLQG